MRLLLSSRRDGASQLLTVIGKVCRLRQDGLTRLLRRQFLGLLGGWHIQHHTGLQAVHVVAKERLWVLTIEPHQHLIQRHTGWQVARGDLGQRVTTLDLHRLGAGVFRSSRARCWRRTLNGSRSRCRGRSSCLLHLGLRLGLGLGLGLCHWLRSGRRRHGRGNRHRSGRRRGHHRSRRRFGRRHWSGWCWRHRRCDDGRSGHRGGGLGCRRIEQQRVFAHQTARRPSQIQDDIDERLLNGPITGNLQIGPTVTAALQSDLRGTQDRVVVNPCRTVGFRRGHTHLEGRALLCTQAGDVDFGTQRFAQSRLNIELTQAQGPGSGRRQRQDTAGGSDCNPIEDKFPRGHRMIFQGVSQVVMEPCDTTSSANG